MPATHDDFLKHFESVRRRTMRVAACIPADQIEWRPAHDAFSWLTEPEVVARSRTT
jgi:hypothetical protein